MTFLVSLFSSPSARVDAAGTWRVTAASPEQAIGTVKSYASSRIWPPDSAWMVVPVPLEQSQRDRQAGNWATRWTAEA